ncbi:uncharacterized protein FFNC_07487 [Fusarium fujikuroi]|nr:uncharacterized protein FFM5_12026 [Fusarium fujikuroi]SCO40445.1 uncharacterized protein FFNC_07487 [Fusarium fujikuroi]SCV37482.1 uncharacterized protein FFB14_06634 [Fusarium fujikuroi]SCV58169.1 uncharacterized protein FFFS_13109 [Fusarium fujikuroi]
MSAMVALGHVHDKERSTTSWRALVLAIIISVCLSSSSGRDVITESGLVEV